jgi:hypothetical protein
LGCWWLLPWSLRWLLVHPCAADRCEVDAEVCGGAEGLVAVPVAFAVRSAAVADGAAWEWAAGQR